MKISKMLNETFECVKINGILRNLTNDEMKIYKRVKEEGKLFKADLTEFEANVATSMVTKGLLRRKKSQQEQGKHGRIYYIARGRKGHLKTKPLEEVAPPDRKIESWIKKNKKRFKDRYGDGYEKYLYGRAWKAYNGKLTESVNDDEKYTVVIDTKASEEEVQRGIIEATEVLDKIDNIMVQSDYQKISDEYEKHRAMRKAYIDIIKYLEREDMFSYDNDINTSFSLENADTNTIYDEIFEGLKSLIREEAYDSGDYNQYGEREYDSDATWDSISNESIVDLINHYTDWDEFASYAEDVIKEINDFYDELDRIQINYQQWDGSENFNDNDMQNARITYEQRRQEIINAIKNKTTDLQQMRTLLTNYLENSDNPSDDSLSEFENLGIRYGYSNNPLLDFEGLLVDESYHKLNGIVGNFETLWDRYKDVAYDGARESGDFDQYSDGEFDSDATWEEVDDHSYTDLVCSFSYSSKVWDYIMEFKSILETIVSTFNRKGIEDSTGEEFDESVTYKI